MIIVQLNGGLGNQMFQYAFGRQLAIINKTKLKFHIAPLKKKNSWNYMLNNFKMNAIIATDNEIFDIKGKRDTSLLNKLLNKFYYGSSVLREQDYSFSEDNIVTKTNLFIIGYWQNEKYFKNIEKTIMKDFRFQDSIVNSNSEYKQKILKSNSISLHIRRGDYLSCEVQNLEVCPLEYYYKAVKKISKKIRSPHFFVFSDDINWIKKNLRIDFPVFFVENNENYQEYLMSCCKHNIIANSSFSWWGAWLNKNDQKIVIAPKKWFAKVERAHHSPVLKEWIVL